MKLVHTSARLDHKALIYFGGTTLKIWVVEKLKMCDQILTDLPILILQRDNWNDFGFNTLYQLYYKDIIQEKEETQFIGDVKILRINQTTSDNFVIPLGENPSLDNSYCSLGQSMDYYERISAFSPSKRNEILTTLQDVIALPAKKEVFEKEKGWNTSILRYISRAEEFLRVAPVFISQDFGQLPDLKRGFSFEIPKLLPKVSFSFSSQRPSSQETLNTALPERISVLIGKNGCGKSMLLSRLARIAHASPVQRAHEDFLPIGSITPGDIGFSKVVTMSYSAFDSFQMPGKENDEKLQIAKEMRSGRGRYFFCGLRDVAKENEDGLYEFSPGYNEATKPNKDYQSKTILKTLDQLYSELEMAFQIIMDKKRNSLFNTVVQPINDEASPNSLSLHFNSEGFRIMSTGHKFLFHALMNLVAHIEPQSLILIDEPETHLHPPLLSTVMKSLRILLREKNSYAVIATHSPIILQETLSKNVHILKRIEDSTLHFHPEIQTYGESISAITNYVFGLTTDYAEHLEVLRKIASESSCINNIEEVLEGDLSVQGRAIVLAELLKKRKKE